jgi:hypothetical protein
MQKIINPKSRSAGKFLKKLSARSAHKRKRIALRNVAMELDKFGVLT